MVSGILAGVMGLASLGAMPQDTTGVLHGRVLSRATGAPIPGAAVRIRHGTGFRLVVTNDDGAYRAERLVAGDALVVADALDHAPLQVAVHIPSGAEVPLDLVLELRPVEMPMLFTRIEAARLRLPVPGLTRGGLREEGETELRALDASPGVAELGLGQGPDPSDPTSTLYVRGAFADLKLVLLDEAPVYAPFHLSGLLDAFPDGVLDEASIYVGGTPAKYDGGLSYVLELDIREGDTDRFRTSGSVDMLGATGRIEGPIGDRARVLLSGRGLHGAGYSLMTGEGELPYGYGDALGRVDVDLGAGHVAATGFWNRESVTLDVGKLEGAAPETAYWGNTAGSARYEVPVGSGTLHLNGSYGRFGTRIPALSPSGDGPVPFTTVRGETSRSRTGVHYSFGESVRWAVGTGLDTHRAVLDQRTVFGDTTIHTVARANVGALWGEATWDATRNVEVRAGLRMSYFEPGDAARFSPRLSATWRLDQNARLKLAAGRFYQVVRGPETILSSDLTGPTVGERTREPMLDRPEPLIGSQLFAVAGANHLVVGLENDLPNGVNVGLEGYFKTFDHLPEAGDLFSSGADIWVQASDGPIRGWLGYSLAWVWTDEPQRDTRFVGRQLLSGGLATAWRGVDLGVRLAYGAGLPFQQVGGGPVSEPGEEPAPAFSGAPDDSYLRIDAEISRRWMGSVGGSTFEVAPYIRLLNALDRRDALFYRSEEEGPTRPVPLSSFPVLAVVGVAWSF